MKSFVILADATCDLSEEFQKEYDIGVIPGHIELPDGTEIPAFLKWEKYSREDFYAALKKNPNGYSTSPANVAEFSAAMEPYAAKGIGVLLMTISSGISGAFSFASPEVSLGGDSHCGFHALRTGLRSDGGLGFHAPCAGKNPCRNGAMAGGQ